jgi:hypothetical protein
MSPASLLTFVLAGDCRITKSMSKSNSESKFGHDRRSVGQSIWVRSRMWGPRPEFCYYLRVAGLFMWGTLPDERTGLSFTIAAPTLLLIASRRGPQRKHFLCCSMQLFPFKHACLGRRYLATAVVYFPWLFCRRRRRLVTGLHATLLINVKCGFILIIHQRHKWSYSHLMLISVDRNMQWAEDNITRILIILISVYNQLLCWPLKYTFNPLATSAFKCNLIVPPEGI